MLILLRGYQMLKKSGGIVNLRHFSVSGPIASYITIILACTSILTITSRVTRFFCFVIHERGRVFFLKMLRWTSLHLCSDF